MSEKGLFITFEGADGAGKSTQLKKVATWLESIGYEVVCTREPGGTANAEKLREVVLDPKLVIGDRAETLLYLASRAEHVRELIKPSLDAGKIVLCDRFSDSTFVYQGLVRGIGIENIKGLNDFATCGIEPKFTLVFDGDPLEFAKRRKERGEMDRLELEGLDFQVKVREGFLNLAAKNPSRLKIVNALASEEEVFALLKALISKELKSK
jgi:dTMP kinase